jgi:hypothetical protein
MSGTTAIDSPNDNSTRSMASMPPPQSRTPACSQSAATTSRLSAIGGGIEEQPNSRPSIYQPAAPKLKGGLEPLSYLRIMTHDDECRVRADLA